MVTGGPRKRFVGARISWRFVAAKSSHLFVAAFTVRRMSQRGIRGFTEKSSFDTNGTPYLLVATKRESSPRKENRRHEKTIVAAKRESSPRKGNRRREKRIVATKENRGTNNGGLRRKILLTQTAPHSARVYRPFFSRTRMRLCGSAHALVQKVFAEFSYTPPLSA